LFYEKGPCILLNWVIKISPDQPFCFYNASCELSKLSRPPARQNPIKYNEL
jgi:hypothetical protein